MLDMIPFTLESSPLLFLTAIFGTRILSEGRTLLFRLLKPSKLSNIQLLKY